MKKLLLLLLTALLVVTCFNADAQDDDNLTLTYYKSQRGYINGENLRSDKIFYESGLITLNFRNKTLIIDNVLVLHSLSNFSKRREGVYTFIGLDDEGYKMTLIVIFIEGKASFTLKRGSKFFSFYCY